MKSRIHFEGACHNIARVAGAVARKKSMWQYWLHRQFACFCVSLLFCRYFVSLHVSFVVLVFRFPLLLPPLPLPLLHLQKCLGFSW